MISIEVEEAAWTDALPDVEVRAEAAARAAVVAARVEGELTILLTDDATQAELNQRFRAKSGSTNVLSFPAAPQPGAKVLGDLSLAYGVCAAEAEAQGKSLGDHLSHLVVHGVLHLAGRDHMSEAEAEAMEAEERTILQALGVADPYVAERAA
ncbi:rRNA maturation RNase YbeY [Brevundimonas balnearis]|uniref:Endoribonuclease YbeY n=1 Tax=Brevundimonas balnearis TaxID=1572858 RepID=A0ABV6R367_9CAUL